MAATDLIDLSVAMMQSNRSVLKTFVGKMAITDTVTAFITARVNVLFWQICSYFF